MPTPLKDQNRSLITAFVVFHGVLFCAMVRVSPLDLELANIAARAGLAGVAVLLATVLNYSLTANTKAKLVYLRQVEVLPAHRAFTVLGPRDARVDLPTLEAFHGQALPSVPSEQNRVWYRWFKRVEERDGVAYAHRMSLLFRDLTALAALLGCAFALVALYYEQSIDVLLYVLFLVASFEALRRAAVNTGERFVTTVLAEYSARPPDAAASARTRAE